MVSDAPRIGCAVLAAGASRRLGRPKQLAPVDGEPLLRRVLAAACRSRCAPVAVVLGAGGATIGAALAGLPVELLDNPLWREGMGTSVRAAAAWARRSQCHGLLLAVGDQVHLSSAHLDALIEASDGGRRLVGSAYEGVLGVPAVFPAALYARLEEASGDSGGRALLRDPAAAARSIAWPAGAVDVDTAADLRRLL